MALSKSQLSAPRAYSVSPACAPPLAPNVLPPRNAATPNLLPRGRGRWLQFSPPSAGDAALPNFFSPLRGRCRRLQFSPPSAGDAALPKFSPPSAGDAALPKFSPPSAGDAALPKFSPPSAGDAAGSNFLPPPREMPPSPNFLPPLGGDAAGRGGRASPAQSLSNPPHPVSPPPPFFPSEKLAAQPPTFSPRGCRPPQFSPPSGGRCRRQRGGAAPAQPPASPHTPPSPSGRAAPQSQLRGHRTALTAYPPAQAPQQRHRATPTDRSRPPW